MDKPSFAFGGPVVGPITPLDLYEQGDVITLTMPDGTSDQLLVMDVTAEGISILSGNAMLQDDPDV